MGNPKATPPTELPVTLLHVKDHVNADDFNDDDDLLEFYTQAAVSYFDGPAGILGRAILDQEVTQSFSALSEQIRLSYGEATAVTSVTYYDADNVQQTLTAALHDDALGSYVWFDLDSLPQTYSRPDAVTIVYRAGWADAASVPANLQQAISILAASWYSVREDMTTGPNYSQVPWGVRALLEPLRRVGV